MTKLKCGLYPTVVTPFHEDGSVDYESLGRLIRLFSQNRCDGVFAVCQSSEMFCLTVEEKARLAEYCVGACRRYGMRCVVSGHTEDSLKEQILCLKRMEAAKPDALVLVLNRLAGPKEDDGVLLGRLQAVMAMLSPQTRLGVYECPYPYKRLLTPVILDFLVKSGRFDFIKDTCCDIHMIRGRISQLAGSSVALYNANAATLAQSLAAGAAGYCGVMLNFVPELFRLLKQAAEEGRSLEQAASKITLYSVYQHQNYPANAKYLLKLRRVIGSDYTRTEHAPLTDAQKTEALQLMRDSECERAKLLQIPGRRLIFSAGRYFPSCHASTILALDDGTILVAYFAGAQEGAGDVGIWLSRRINGQWREPVCIAKDGETAHWNPVLFKTGDGIRIVYKVSAPDGWKSKTRVSTDSGRTWSGAAGYAPPNEACGPVRSKPILLSNGALLAPDSVETKDTWLPRVDISRDGGKTFSVLSQIPINRTHPERETYIEGLGAIQPALWESAPGAVHALLRTTAGWVFRSDSRDYGATWCEAYNTGIPNNNSGIETVCDKGRLYLVCDPVSGNWAARTPLVVKVSDDNGETFSDFCALDTAEYDPSAGKGAGAEFSYPSAVICKGRLYIAYTCHRRQIAFYEIGL